MLSTTLCVRIALFSAASLIVPLFKARALALILMPSVSLSPAWIVYVKTSGALPVPEAYVAVRLSLPTARVSCGVHVLFTTSLKVTVADTTSGTFRKLF